MTKVEQALTPVDAVDRVEALFPIKDYYEGDRAPRLTVANVVAKYLKPGDRVYDFGAGACDKTAVAQLMGCQCTAMDDLADNWYQRGDIVSKIEGFAEELGIDFIRKFGPLDPESFQAVMMHDVLEHIHDSPREILNGLVSGLSEGGYLIVTVPNLANIRKRLALMRGRTNLPNYDLYYWYEGTWRGPQREYVRGDLVSMCKNLGLEVEELTTVHHMLGNLSAKLQPIYKGVTRIFPDWKDSWLLVARKPAGWTPRLKISDTEFAEIYGKTSSKTLYEQSES